MAIAKASPDISKAEIFTSCKCFLSVMAMHPLPVPMSKSVMGWVFSMIQSTNSSVSGLGINTAGLTLNGKP
ncbi:hypothetical protein D9M68_910230 [compost metagenome]